MANVLHRITKQYLISVHTLDYPTNIWIRNPILPECDSKWWAIEGDLVREMTQDEKDELSYYTKSTIYLIAEKQLLTDRNGHDYEADSNAIINPVMPPCDLKYTKVEGGIVIEMTQVEKDALDLATAQTTKQDLIKQECTTHILEAYPDTIQRSAALGIYSSNVIDEIQIFIAGCIGEENRCFDDIEIATTIAEVELVTPVFPEA